MATVVTAKCVLIQALLEPYPTKVTKPHGPYSAMAYWYLFCCYTLIEIATVQKALLPLALFHINISISSVKHTLESRLLEMGNHHQTMKKCTITRYVIMKHESLIERALTVAAE